MNSSWIPYFYQYGISAIVFFAGIAIAIRARALDIRYAHERWTLVQLLVGFAAMMILHGVMIAVAGV